MSKFFNKKLNWQSKDIYDILLKNKNEKAKEFDNQRKNAEDTSRTIDIFLGKSNSSKMSNETKEAQQKQANKVYLINYYICLKLSYFQRKH